MATNNTKLNKGDTIFVISRTQNIQEAKFFGETHLDDGSIWAIWTEDWDTEDREGMCFCCQKHRWSASKEGAISYLQKIILEQKAELLAEVAELDASLENLSN